MQFCWSCGLILSIKLAFWEISLAVLQQIARHSAGSQSTWTWVFPLAEAPVSNSEESGPKNNHRRHLSRLYSQVNYSRLRETESSALESVMLQE